jgi:hypothetical protein
MDYIVSFYFVLILMNIFLLFSFVSGLYCTELGQND